MRSRLATFGVVLLATVAVATSAAAVGGGGAARATSSSVVVDPAAVPWSEVGPGWELVAWEPHPHAKQNNNYIELVSPLGTMYADYATGPGTRLVAWAGDRTTALLQAGDRFELLDLTTGTLVHTFRLHVPSGATLETPSFTWPMGLSLYFVEGTGNWRKMDAHPERTSLTGTVEARFPGSSSAVGSFNGSMLSSSDGTQVVFGGLHGLAVFSNEGTLTSQLVMRQARGCAPNFFWSATEVLAACSDGPYQRLIMFSLTTGKWWAIDQRPRGTDLGDLQAWRGGSTVYVEVASACAYRYVAILQGDAPKFMNVPGVPQGQSDWVIDATSNSVLVGAAPACYGGREVVIWYTPSTGAAHQILGPPVVGGLIDGIQPYPAAPYGTPSAFGYY
jgi:TolB protein